MKLRLERSQTSKHKLSNTMRNWLPILQSNIESLKEVLEPYVEENPFVELKLSCETKAYEIPKREFFSKRNQAFQKSSFKDTIESLSFQKKSLYEVVSEQISPPLFPTKKSQKIAYEILDYINEEGYFENTEEQIAKKLFVTAQEIEKIRQRFAYLDPPGVGAKDFKESFLFQLYDINAPDKIYSLAKKMIEDFENIEKYTSYDGVEDALKIIKKFKIPPALEFFEDNRQIIPDIFVYESKGMIEVKLNSAFYPEIIIDSEGVDESYDFVKQKIKDAKDLIDALEMRKATLYKIGLMIVEYQYDFFFGGAIKPMKLKDIAMELGRNPSTISRAISNKYLSCNRGVMPLKKFFAAALDEETSNETIKEYLCELIKSEDKKKPLSDIKILKMIESKFKIKMVRRTITKYRKQLNIAGSSERKRLYIINS